jgi:hypothetical protein
MMVGQEKTMHLQRIEYERFRDNGWPLCPNCDEDELWCPGSVQFHHDNGRPPTLAECLAMGLACYNCQQQIPGSTHRFWRVVEHDVWDEWQGQEILYGVTYYDVQQKELIALRTRRIPGMSAIDELKEILRIEDMDQRQTAVIVWWEGLGEKDRQGVVALSGPLIAVWQIWASKADYLGQLAKQMLDTWSKVVEESPERQAYMAALEAKGKEDSVRAFLAKNAADVRLETTRLEGIADGDGLLHWVPPDAYRVTACGQVTPITNLKMDGRAIAEQRDLCPECWSEMEDAWWSDEYEEWFTGDGEEE